MPRLNALGHATTGLGVTFWRDDGDVTLTNAHGPLALSDGTPIDPHGANVCYAKDGHWIAFLVGFGVFGNTAGLFGHDLPAAGLIPDPFSSDYIAADGTYAYKTVYQSAGAWTLVNPDGTAQAFGTDPSCVQVLGASSVLWTEQDGTLHSLNVSVLLTPRKVWWPRLVDGHLLYQDQATSALVLDGHVIAPPGNYYRPDVRGQGDGFLVVSSPTEGEGVAVPLVVSAAQLAAAPTIDQYAPEPPPVPIPIPVPVPEPPPMSVPDFSPDVHAACTARPDLVAANSLASVAELVHLACEAMHAKDPGFVYLSKVPGETQYEGRSQDSVIYVPANATVKLFSGAGDPHPAAPVWVVGGAPRDTDHPIYPDPATFGASPMPPPDPPPSPSPDPRFAALQAEIDAIKAQLAALPPPGPPVDLSAYAKHGDAVTVTGHMTLNFFGASIRTQDATLTGTITK